MHIYMGIIVYEILIPLEHLWLMTDWLNAFFFFYGARDCAQVICTGRQALCLSEASPSLPVWEFSIIIFKHRSLVMTNALLDCME